jgi:hypothetical protein
MLQEDRRRRRGAVGYDAVQAMQKLAADDVLEVGRQ